MCSQLTSLHSNTPTISVLDNRGQVVRDIAYHRHPDSPTLTEERISRHRFTPTGSLQQSSDPRMHAAGQANFTYLTSLVGEVLLSNSLDAGHTLALADSAGRPLLAVSASRLVRTWQYENDTLPGRPLALIEQAPEQAPRVTERFVWAAHSPAEKDLNLAGQCIRHYDPAGLLQTDSIALSGVPLAVTRRLLKDADQAETLADWQTEDASAWSDLLDPVAYTTLTTADATGALLTSTDAAGHRQRLAYDVAGLLKGSWLQLAGAAELVVVRSLSYSAAGQKLREEHGNGVISTYLYEPQTQRLLGIKTERPKGHAAGAKVLQDLRYDYDRVGNVLSVRNDAEEARFWRNQKVVPENTYRYDSLYQLVSATGREMASAGQQGSSLPQLSSFDNHTYTHYTRTYTYDNGGNLRQIRHSAPASGNGYTTDITVSNRSNRAVLSLLTEDPDQVDTRFDAAGHQLQLLPGQHLAWTPRGELQQVTPVTRIGQASDHEHYRYDAGSQRVLKVTTQHSDKNLRVQRTRYLPGLEWRSLETGGREKEQLHTVIVGAAGRAQVRALHWQSGKPDGMSNGQLRYSYDNLIGSSGLEVDETGQLISLEEYYPYGGTAVWVARNQTEAHYKTVRYSGKEQDATGLYYYGYRYYQPWAGRWLSADPAGIVDGLNLFRMVRNNPISLSDPDGRQALDYLDLAQSRISEHASLVDALFKQHPHLETLYGKFSDNTKGHIQMAIDNTKRLSKLKPSETAKTAAEMRLTEGKLGGLAAHAAATGADGENFLDGFMNLPGSLSEKSLFSGVKLMSRVAKKGFEDVHAGTLAKSDKFKPRDLPGRYKVVNIEALMGGIKEMYVSTGTALHALTESRIRSYIENEKYQLPNMAGIPGLHAEVQAFNKVVTNIPDQKNVLSTLFTDVYIFTKRLTPKGMRCQDFCACANCSGILKGPERIMTGRVQTGERLQRRRSVS